MCNFSIWVPFKHLKSLLINPPSYCIEPEHWFSNGSTLTPMGTWGSYRCAWQSSTLSILSDIDQYGHICALYFHLFYRLPIHSHQSEHNVITVPILKYNLIFRKTFNMCTIWGYLITIQNMLWVYSTQVENHCYRALGQSIFSQTDLRKHLHLIKSKLDCTIIYYKSLQYHK